MLSNSEVTATTVNTIDIEEIDNDKALMGFIVDYLIKRGFEKTITTLYDETPKSELIPKSEISSLICSVSEIRGNEQSGLSEWWRVFWEILKETKRSKRVKISYEVDRNKNIAYAIEESKRNNTTGTYDTQTTSIMPTAPKRIRKKQPITIPTISTIPASTNQPILDTLDLTSLTGIEKSLTSSGLMNKDLNKLTSLEAKRIEVALKSNKVSREAWEIYLKLCKEYQRIPQNIQVHSNNNKMLQYSPYINAMSSINNVNSVNVQSVYPPSFPNSLLSNSLSIANSSYNNYMGVIDQVNQPIDSKQLLMFRQSLYQEYLKKQQAAMSIISVKENEHTSPSIGSLGSVGSAGSIISIGSIGSNGYSNQNINHNSNQNSNNCSITLTSSSNPNLISPPEITNNNFTESPEKEEFLYEFINEYLI